MSEIHFKIDGMERVAQPGDTILKAAAEAGINIPTLCYNQKISKTTSCFVCVVKDKKTGRFLPSCSACPTEGQEIDASSDEVKEMRRTALGLLLSEHSGDCEAPCTMACPAHASVEEYVRAGKQGDFLKALKIITFRMDWLDFLAIQGTLRSLLQHHSSKASVLWRSAFFTIQL